MSNQSSWFEAEEIGRVKITEEMSLRARIVNGDLDIRIWLASEKYTGPTKKGIRLHSFNHRWPQFKELMEKVDKKHKELVS